MTNEIRNNLSLSDFGEFKREHFEDGIFKYALIRYQQYVVMINSVEWYQTIKNGQAVPGSISIAYEPRVRYKTDPQTKLRIKDEYGKEITEKTGEWGWILIAVKNINRISEEAKLQGRVDALVHVKDQIVFAERNKAAVLEMEYQKMMHLSDELKEKITRQLSISEDAYEIDEEEEEEEESTPAMTETPSASTVDSSTEINNQPEAGAN